MDDVEVRERALRLARELIGPMPVEGLIADARLIEVYLRGGDVPPLAFVKQGDPAFHAALVARGAARADGLADRIAPPLDETASRQQKAGNEAYFAAIARGLSDAEARTAFKAASTAIPLPSDVEFQDGAEKLLSDLKAARDLAASKIRMTGAPRP